MKKMKRLLSVLLAMIMAFSCFSVAGSAFQAYENPGSYFYDSNDNPRAYLYTPEQRASIIMDMLDELLAGLNIKTKVLTVNVDLTSYDALCETLNNRAVGAALSTLAGDLSALDYSRIKGTSRAGLGDTGALDRLGETLALNGELVYDILNAGEIDLGLIGTLAKIDVSAVNKILADLPSLLGGLIYGIGNRQITNGIGNDPEYPNTTKWDDVSVADRNSKYTLDKMVESLLKKLLVEPNHTIPTSDPARNEIITNPTAFGATAEMIHVEDETGYYYIYGKQSAAGKWNFTENSTVANPDGTEGDKQYICQWDDNSGLLKPAAGEELLSFLKLNSGSMYSMIEKAVPWAYDTFGGHNLDGQLRATLMQFCGAFNNGESDKLTDEVKAELKSIMDAYKAQEQEGGYDKQILRDVFAAETGRAGNYNFMYIDLEGKDINDKTSDSLYYVVEWNGSYQYYHVERTDVSPFYDLIDWEYQAPMWSEIMAKTTWTTGTSIIQHINVIAGEILKSAIPTLEWTAGTADGTLAANVTALVKLVIKTDAVKLFGEGFTLPADFDSFGLERVLVMIAGKILDDLMPQLVIPASATSVEEVLVYALREFMAEILPHLGAGWDEMIADAEALTGSAKEDAFLNIALNMGASTGAYYLQNLIGYGTRLSASETTVVDEIKIGADYTWQEILSGVIDWVVATWLPNLTSNIDLSSTDPLLKLSAVFSKLFPTLVGLLNAGDGTYALNLNTVYNWLREILNGNFAPFAKGLMRHAGTGDMTLVTGIANLITDLFGGLGFENQSSWGNLKGLFTTALTKAEPIQALIGNYGTRTSLAKLARYLVECLGQSRAIWLTDATTFIAMLLGYESQLAVAGFIVDGIEKAYAGSDKASIDYSITMNTKGVKTYFNNGRYKSNDGALAGETTGFDGDYKIQYNKVWVEDANGVVKAGPVAYDITVEPNVEKPLPTFELTGIPYDPEVWTMVNEYQIIAPDGTLGEPVENRQEFIVTTQVNDALSPVWKTYTNTSDVVSNQSSNKYDLDIYAQYGYTNVYINEYESLSKVSEAMLTLKAANVETVAGKANKVHSYTKIWTNGYGYNITNDDGSIKVTSDAEGKTLLDLTTVTPISLNGKALNNDQLQALWLKWGLNESQPQTGHTAGSTSKAEGKFLVAETNEVRSDFTEDFYTYAITATPVVEVNWNALSTSWFQLKQETKAWYSRDGKVAVPQLNPYVILYNSYGLEDVLNESLGLVAKDFDLTTSEAQAAWAEYQAAVKYANNELYGNWNAPTFADEHKTKEAYTYVDEDDKTQTLPVGSSTFQYAVIRLEEAVEAIELYRAAEEVEEVTVVAPSDPSSELYPIYSDLKAADDEGLQNQNYVLYRWYKYHDARTAIRNVLNAATPPTEAQNSLVGVALDNKGIEGVINTITDADVKAIVEGLVKAPSQEAVDYANEAIENFVMPAYDVTSLRTQVQAMQTAKSRLISKYDTNNYYYLNDAISKYGNEAAADYTAGSYARYTEKLAKAQEVLAAAKDNNSTQYDIHSSRYEFLIAYNQLVKVADAADTSKIEAMYVEAQDILNKLNTADEVAVSNTEITKEEAYEQLLLAMGYPVDYKAEGATEATRYYVGGNFTAAYVHDNAGMFVAAKRQTWLSDLEANLQAALDNFKSAAEAPELAPVEGSTGVIGEVVVDEETGFTTGYLYGVTAGEAAEGYFALVDADAGTVEWSLGTASNVNGTGAIATVKDTNGNAVAEFTLVIFGDVNGDASVTATDKAAVSKAALGGAIEGDANTKAADVNGDAAVTATDSAAVSKAALGGEITVNPYVA